MSEVYQQKLDNVKKLYPDAEMPISARHAFELFVDLHDLGSQLTGRVAQLEAREKAIEQELG